MNKCNKINELIIESIYGQLMPEEQSRLQNHLKSCETCSETYQELLQLPQIMAKKKRPMMSEEYWQDYNTKLEAKLFQPQEKNITSISDSKHSDRNNMISFRFKWAIVPVAAAILVVTFLSLSIIISKKRHDVMEKGISGTGKRIHPALAAYFDNVKPLLIDYSTSLSQETDIVSDSDTIEIDQSVLFNLLLENQLLKKQVARQNNITVKQLMDDIELILLELQGNGNQSEIRKNVQQLIKKNDILFKMRVLRKTNNQSMGI